MTGGTGEFSIGGDLWPGLSKLIEENGELSELLPEAALTKTLALLQKTSGKLIGSEGRTDHWSGDLRRMLHEEIADVLAALNFFTTRNGLDKDLIHERAEAKLNTFARWEREAQEKRA